MEAARQRSWMGAVSAAGGSELGRMVSGEWVTMIKTVDCVFGWW